MLLILCYFWEKKSEIVENPLDKPVEYANVVSGKSALGADADEIQEWAALANEINSISEEKELINDFDITLSDGLDEEVKPAGLTAQVKESRTVSPTRKRITQPDNGLGGLGLVQRTDKIQPGEV